MNPNAMTAAQAIALAEDALDSDNPSKAVSLAILEAHTAGAKFGMAPTLKLLRSISEDFKSDGQPMPDHWRALLIMVESIVKENAEGKTS